MKSNMEFSELQQIVESNCCAIQALADQVVESNLNAEAERRSAAEERRELREAMLRLRVSEGLINLYGSLDEDRPTILRKLNVIEHKVDRLLERGDS